MRARLYISPQCTHRRWKVLGVLGLLSFGFASLVHGQATATILTVLLRDTAGQPIADAAVRVIDAASLQPLANGRTNGSGSSTIFDLPTTTIRVVVEGVLPDGTPLVLLGQDAEGIRVTLPPTLWLMDLRVAADGTVFPDMGLTGAGAADGADHVGIVTGTFGHVMPVASSISAAIPAFRPTTLPVSTNSAGLAPPLSTYEYVVGLMFMLVFGSAIAAIIVFGRRI